MKFLFSLLASLMLLAPAASAETWWLIIAGKSTHSEHSPRFFEKIPMQSEEQCKAAGKAIRYTEENEDSSNYDEAIYDIFFSIRYLCVVGK